MYACALRHKAVIARKAASKGHPSQNSTSMCCRCVFQKVRSASRLVLTWIGSWYKHIFESKCLQDIVSETRSLNGARILSYVNAPTDIGTEERDGFEVKNLGGRKC